MNWLSVENYDQMSRHAADQIHAALVTGCAEGQRLNLGLATGNTMIGLYRLLAERLNQDQVDLRGLHTYNLDEYVGSDRKAIPESHPLSYRKYMQEQLFDALDPALGFTAEQAHFPAPDETDRFDRDLATAGGLDFQLLGIGFNGHIAFNEPMNATEISAAEFASLPSRTIALRELTIQTNARLTAGDDSALVPRHAVTMGMKQIVAAREILLLACFPEQAEPLNKMLHGTPTPELPASCLLGHGNATVVYTADTIELNTT
ncbi:MAG: glucosamine-6-phosphate deaminase [Lentisphaerae bacterium]|jgi:glucosamine-6-phosphate deaminase|nr:glucosamine-6-phosphate deaminase [Lentisphaerota bacterium]MBT4819702.1 glucosamine-6-phosphate deaminase [Lentisphaerota bacterium]MBT5605641.1 glucosamine-6-phosphate deaminase [Lentisphaerota bacterium]MBT7054445.1 glucosamine-6-phosphate deaminase [Lentisphaerota bacterium]MBT7842675.1 glucosamine-6-phosphate deaminase [Lentisphaerota bacterium]